MRRLRARFCLLYLLVHNNCCSCILQRFLYSFDCLLTMNIMYHNLEHWSMKKIQPALHKYFASSIFRELKDYTIVILFFLLWGNSLTFLFKNNKRFYARHTVGKSASWKAHYRLSCPLPVILYQTFFSSDIAPLLLKQNSSPVWSILEMFSYFQGTKSQVCLQFSYCPFKDALLLKWRWIFWAITRNVSARLWNVCVWSSIYLYVYL